MNKHFFVVFLSIILCNSIYSQDIHLSQYKEAPLLLNPALTGRINGDWRVGMNYREQWTNVDIPYNTFNFYADTKIFLYTKAILVGGYILLDQTHNDGLTKVSITPSIAYEINYLGNNIKVGLQPGIGHYSINNSLTHPDQFNYETGKFDNTLPTLDTPNKHSKLFIDVGIGAHWSRPVLNLEPNIGLAFYHLNNPKISIYSKDNTYRLPIKSILNLDVPVPLSSNIAAIPSVLLIKQRKSQELIFGIDGEYKTSGKSDLVDMILFGVHYRNAKLNGLGSMFFIGGLEFKNIRLALSYDEYLKSSKNISSIGSTVEISISYTGINTFIDKFSIPCETY